LTQPCVHDLKNNRKFDGLNFEFNKGVSMPNLYNPYVHCKVGKKMGNQQSSLLKLKKPVKKIVMLC